MTSLISPVPEVHHIHIRELKAGQVIKVARAVRVDRETLFITESGQAYTSRRQGWAFTPGHEASMSMVRALQKLGVITTAQMKAHIAIGERIRKRTDDRWSARSIQEHAQKLGIKLTAAQLKKIEEAKGGTT